MKVALTSKKILRVLACNNFDFCQNTNFLVSFETFSIPEFFISLIVAEVSPVMPLNSCSVFYSG